MIRRCLVRDIDQRVRSAEELIVLLDAQYEGVTKIVPNSPPKMDAVGLIEMPTVMDPRSNKPATGPKRHFIVEPDFTLPAKTAEQKKSSLTWSKPLLISAAACGFIILLSAYFLFFRSAPVPAIDSQAVAVSCYRNLQVARSELMNGGDPTLVARKFRVMIEECGPAYKDSTARIFMQKAALFTGLSTEQYNRFKAYADSLKNY